ncbi:MAG: FkbM family methyltransferase [Alphaproteobacteria bacterium]|nr:MAG: FkbM family methyltransferase [Alphaproteobacteria bacterium]
MAAMSLPRVTSPAEASNRMEFSNRCLYGVFQFFSHIPLLKRLYPSMQKGWAALTWPGGHKVKHYNGALFLLDYKKLPDRKVALHGGHELRQHAYFFSQLMKKSCDVFLDVGANIGLYTIDAASHGVPEIHAFEPDPRNYAQLHANLYLNKLAAEVRTYPIGLSDKSGSLEFDLAPDAKTNLTKVAAGSTASSHTQKLPVKPLDEVVPCTGKKIFLKIDVEGHEHAVLKGAARLLANNDCFLQVEAWPENAPALTAYLETFGYKLVHRIQDDYYFERPFLAAAQRTAATPSSSGERPLSEKPVQQAGHVGP